MTVTRRLPDRLSTAGFPFEWLNRSDGIPDLITNATGPNNTAGFTVQLGNGKGGFTTASTVTAPASFVLNAGNTLTAANTTFASTYAVADVNGDGKADLVFIDHELPGVSTPGTGFVNYDQHEYDHLQAGRRKQKIARMRKRSRKSLAGIWRERKSSRSDVDAGCRWARNCSCQWFLQYVAS